MVVARLRVLAPYSALLSGLLAAALALAFRGHRRLAAPPCNKPTACVCERDKLKLKLFIEGCYKKADKPYCSSTLLSMQLFHKHFT